MGVNVVFRITGVVEVSKEMLCIPRVGDVVKVKVTRGMACYVIYANVAEVEWDVDEDIVYLTCEKIESEDY